jgi:hypothetical protein
MAAIAHADSKPRRRHQRLKQLPADLAQIKNPKFVDEIRNKFESSNFKYQTTYLVVSSIRIWDLEFVSDFGFRISIFEICTKRASFDGESF